MKSKAHIVAIVLTAVVIFIFGIPIVINALYKSEIKYFITAWNAADVLSFYGNVLGASVTAFGLGLSVWLSKRQIAHDAYLRKMLERWKSIEAVIGETLTALSPSNFILKIDDIKDLSNYRFIQTIRLQQYQIFAKQAILDIDSYVSALEYKEIKELVYQIRTVFESFSAVIDKFLKENDYVQNSIKDDLPAADYPPSYKDSLGSLYEAVGRLYKGSYQNLFDLKRDTFEKIYADIEKTADQMLEFGRRK